MNKMRILVVDDHQLFRKGVVAAIRDERPDWEVCGEASTSADGNTYTLKGIQGGPVTLTGTPGTPGSYLKIKSDGTKWWRVG